MFPRKSSTLALVAAGALSLTTVSVPAAHATGVDAMVQSHTVQSTEIVRPTRDVPGASLSVWPGDAALAPGQTLTLEATYDTGTPGGSHVTWKTSDSSLATVDDNGLVTAVGPGEVAVIATDKQDSSIEAVSWIRIRSVSEDAGIELSESGVTRTPGKSVFLNALLSPSFLGRPVEWTVTPATLGTVETGPNEQTAILTTSDQPGSGTLTATVTSQGGQKKTVSIPLTVVAAPQSSDDFIINDSGVLTGYRGSATDVVIPDGVTEIGRRAFDGHELDSVWVPASVQTLAEEAFYGANLKKITFQDDDEHPSQLTWVGSQAFAYSTLETVSLPRAVKDVDNYAFSYMDYLTSVRLGPNVSSTRLSDAFVRSPRLTSIEVDEANATYASVDGVVYSKDRATLVVFPSGKNATGSYAVPEGTTTIGVGAFAVAQLESVTLPDSLREVASRAFEQSSITAVALPDAFETVGERAFWYMPQLKRVDLGGTVKVSDSAFYSSGVTEMNLRPDLNRLTEIADGAFNWTSATSITLPDSVTTIGKEAFANNAALTTFHLGASAQSLGDFALGEDNNLTELSVSPSNTELSVEIGVLYQKISSGRRLLLSLPTNSATEYKVTSGTTEIAPWAFAHNTALRRVVLPKGLTTIGYGAFDGCSNLIDLSIPNSVRVSEGVINTGLDTVEYGTKIRSIEMNARDARIARHIIVRGGVEGSFYTEGAASNGRPESAFFGEGMTKIEFMTQAPRILVLPSSLKELVLERFPEGGTNKDTDVYVAAPQGSDAWEVASAAMKDAGIDASHLHVYKPTRVTLSGQGIGESRDGYKLSASAGTPATVKVSAEAGVSGGREMRVVQMNADGSRKVLQNWTAMSTSSDALSAALSYTWTPTDGQARLRIYVRDGSRIVRATTLTVDGTSAPRNGKWMSDSRGWWYRYSDGSYPVGERVTIGGQVYRFGADGYMRVGWVSEQGSWFFHGGSGAEVSGWVKDGGSWYYLTPGSGAMATGWVKDGGSWYYLTPGSGAMATGWVKDGGSWYYLTPGSGAMATGWVKDGGSWYYLTPGSGAMVTGRVLIGASWYRFDESGRWVG